MPRAQHRQIDFLSLASQIRQDGNEGQQAAEGPGKGKYGVKEDRGRLNAQHLCAGGSERKKVVPHFGAPIIYKLGQSLSLRIADRVRAEFSETSNMLAQNKFP